MSFLGIDIGTSGCKAEERFARYRELYPALQRIAL
jgi:hypothetical protein